MNAIIYTRYSPRPAKEGDAERIAANEDAESIQLQIDTCQRYAVMKSLVITETIKDPETSARQTPLFEREGGSRLKFLPRGTHVICSKLDRVFRSTADGLLTMNHFKRQGIILHFADQSGCTLDLSTGEGEFMFTILLAAASLEPRRTADRTSKAMKHRQDNGQRMTSERRSHSGRWRIQTIHREPLNARMNLMPSDLHTISKKMVPRYATSRSELDRFAERSCRRSP